MEATRILAATLASTTWSLPAARQTTNAVKASSTSPAIASSIALVLEREQRIERQVRPAPGAAGALAGAVVGVGALEAAPLRGAV